MSVRIMHGGAEAAAAADAEGIERRRHRRNTVLLKALVYPIDQHCGAVVHEASRTGLIGESDVRLTEGQTVHLSSDEQSHHAGVVSWTRGHRFGMALDDAIAALGLDDGRDAMRRLAFRLPVRLSVGPAPFAATVRNTSRSGMLLVLGHGLEAGRHLLIRLGDRPVIAAQVQWSRDGRAGVRTAALLSTLQLVYSADKPGAD